MSNESSVERSNTNPIPKEWVELGLDDYHFLNPNSSLSSLVISMARARNNLYQYKSILPIEDIDELIDVTAREDILVDQLALFDYLVRTTEGIVDDYKMCGRPLNDTNASMYKEVFENVCDEAEDYARDMLDIHDEEQLIEVRAFGKLISYHLINDYGLHFER